MANSDVTYVICVENSGYPVALELRKLYQLLPDARAEADGLVRVIDESGEDYLYSARFFRSHRRVTVGQHPSSRG